LTRRQKIDANALTLAVYIQHVGHWYGTCNTHGVAIHINPLQHQSIERQPVSKAPARSVQTEPFGNMLGILTGRTSPNPAAGAIPTTTTTSTTTTTPAATSTTTPPAAPVPVVSSDGTSLANLMAAASYAGVPYADLGQVFNGTGSFDPNWQQKMANALEARLQSVAGTTTSNQVYDPNPANDSVPFDPTNAKPLQSNPDTIQGLLNNMWSAVHAGDVKGYHTALQQVDAWYQSNGQQNYYTGLTDAQVAAFNGATAAQITNMPNANSTVAAAELAAITGQSASATNLAAVAQSAMMGTVKT